MTLMNYEKLLDEWRYLGLKSCTSNMHRWQLRHFYIIRKGVVSVQIDGREKRRSSAEIHL